MWSLWQFIGVWLLVSLIPYAMYLVAYVFESRKPGSSPGQIPVWVYQSRALMPGDFGLALFTTGGLSLYVEGDLYDWSTGWWWLWLVGPLLSLITLYVGRRVLYSAGDYSPRAWRSPSKRYHDYVMYGLFPLAVVWWVIPGYAAGFLDQDGAIGLAPAVGVAGLSVWVFGIYLDAHYGEVPNERQHPSQWQPIWVTRRLWRQQPGPRLK